MALSASDQKDAFLWTAVLSFILAVKSFAAYFAIGGKRVAAGKRAPEDSYAQTGLSEEDQRRADEELYRAERLGMNDLENVPLGLIAMLVSYMSLSFDGEVDTHVALMLVLVIGRVIHHACYVLKMSLPRTVGWFIGVVGFLGLFINAIANAA